jgi:lysophospholipase L1-like esterase
METGQSSTPRLGRSLRRRWRWGWLLLGGVVVAGAGVAVASAMVLGGTDRIGPGSLIVPPGEATSSVAPGDTAVVFLGDSYTEGWGATEPSTRWSALVAEEAGWVELNQGQGGTGFVTTSSFGGCGLDYCPTYVERVPDVLAAEPDIVVIAGGQNDLASLSAEPDAVRAAVMETYEGIRTGLPRARIIAVGPSTARPGNALIEKLDGWVQAAATSVGADYVSLIDPVTIEPDMVSPDGVHVNDEGHRAIADRVLRGIRTG